MCRERGGGVGRGEGCRERGCRPAGRGRSRRVAGLGRGENLRGRRGEQDLREWDGRGGRGRAYSRTWGDGGKIGGTIKDLGERREGQ